MQNYIDVIEKAENEGTLVALGYLALKDETLSREQMRELAHRIMEKKVLLEVNKKV